MSNDPEKEDAPRLLEGIFKILHKFMPQHIEKICPQCGTSISKVRATGKLGCSQCHENFTPELEYFFIQSNEIEETTSTRKELDIRLQEAIKKEDYELAVILRDQIKKLN